MFFFFFFIVANFKSNLGLSLLDDENPTSANLGNDHGFTIKEYYLYWYETF